MKQNNGVKFEIRKISLYIYDMKEFRVADFLTVNDAAELIGVSAVRVWQYLDEGRLEKYRAFGRVVVRRRDAERVRDTPSKRGRPRKARLATA